MARKVKDPKIRKEYKPSDKEEEILSDVYDRYDKMSDNPQRSDAEEEWDRAEKAWDQYAKEDELLEDWQAKYYVPLTTSVVEAILAEMIDNSPRPLILPWSGEDKPKATVMKHAFEYTWDVGDGDEELENVLKDCLIYGNGFAQEYYWKDRRMIRSLSGVNKEKNGRVHENYKELEVFDYDDSYMECVSPYELFFDEVARSINRGPYKARDAIRRYVMKLDTAKEFFKGDVWNPYDNMKYVSTGQGADTNYYSFFKPPEDIDKSDEVEVLWYWSRTPKDALNIVINDVLIKAGPNPYKHKQLPFAMTYDVKRPHKFYHKGEPKLLEAMQKEVNTLRRMITDRNHLDIDKMFLVQRNETYSEEDSITRPGGTIRVDDPANYKPIEYGDVPNSVNVTLQEINRDATKVTGVEIRTQDSKPAITATDAAIMKEMVVKRIAAKLRRLEKGFLIDIGRMRVANIIQFYSQPKLEKIIGEAGTEQYRKMILTAQKQGLLTAVDGKPYMKKFREIRVKDRELVPSETGEIMEKPIKGYSFFVMTPDRFMPIARGGFDIKFAAGSTMPVSKSLLAKQAQDVANMLMPLASAGIGYDPVKLGDWILETLDKDPEELKLEEEPGQQIEGARNEMQINLATQENEQIAKGAPIPPMGTPYANSGHTMIHIAFLRSPTGKQLPEANFKALTKHAMGEISAQAMRGDVSSLMGEGQPQLTPNGGNQSAVPPQTPGAPPQTTNVEATNPNMIPGGESTPAPTQKGSFMNKVFSLMGRKR